MNGIRNHCSEVWGSDGGSERAFRRSFLSRPVMYPGHYVWFVLLVSMDIMLTRIVLFFGGREVNWLAEIVLSRWDLVGVVILKFGLVLLVVFLCELIGRSSERTGRRVAEWAVAITAIPIVLAYTQLIVAVHA